MIQDLSIQDKGKGKGMVVTLQRMGKAGIQKGGCHGSKLSSHILR